MTGNISHRQQHSNSIVVSDERIPTWDHTIYGNAADLDRLYGPDSVYYGLVLDAKLPLQEFDEFREYLDLFFTFNRKSPCHVKRSYIHGWPKVRPQRRKDRSYYDPPCWDGLIARHLDNDRWRRLHPDREEDDLRPYWVGLRPGKMSRLRCIDLDNKHAVVGYYDKNFLGRTGREFADDPFQPISVVTIAHLLNVKRLYDSLPPQVWCISSHTLGLHVWQTYSRPWPLCHIEATTRPILRQVGLPHTEIHPMANQVLRRPFGQHYYTITESCLLEDWMDQLRFFKNPEPVSFGAIVGGLCRLMRTRLHDYERHGLLQTWSDGHFAKSGVVRIEVLEQHINCIEGWRADGCPEMTKTSVSVQGESFLAPLGSSSSTSTVSRSTPVVDLADVCNRRWVQTCREWAVQGLPCDDSLNPVVMELSRWFYFIEFFHVAEDERLARVTSVMKTFIKNKHNGFVSRLNAGQLSEVESHVERTVRSAIATAAKKEVFAEIRQKRANGTYRHVIYLEPVIASDSAEGSILRSVYKCAHKELDETPLPDEIAARLTEIAALEKMRRRNGEYPFVKFARRLLNVIWTGNGQARIPHATLQVFLDKKPDSKDRHHALRYKKLLAKYGVIHGDWEKYLRRNAASCLYRMTKDIQQVFESDYQRQAQRNAI